MYHYIFKLLFNKIEEKNQKKFCVLKGEGTYPQTSQFETKVTLEQILKRDFLELCK